MKRLILLLSALLLLVLFGPWLLPRPGLDGRIPDAPFDDSRFAEIDGIRLHWRERNGDGADVRPLVVLLHGFGGSAYSWRHTLDALEADGLDVIAPDLPPFGYSARSTEGLDWASLVLTLAERVRPDTPVIWIGHSMGASVAAQAAGRRPDRSADLILVAGTPSMRQRGGLLARLAAFPSFARAAESWAAWRLVDEARLGGLLESAYGRPPTAEELRAYRAPLIIPGTYPALLRRLASEPGGPASPQASPEPQPLPHLIWGERDRWVPRTRGETYLQDRPEAGPIRIIAEAGHNPMETHPDAFHRILAERLAHIPALQTAD